jgi:hypothetical protein
MDNINTVSIKFKPGTYGIFRNLQNKYWYAIGEYVDNAVQSFENNKLELIKANNGKYQFEVRINFDWENNFIRIFDNAAGIDSQNFLRAFEPANIPTDNTGLHEFGMGMKTASIWLSDLWSVRTSALGEDEERFVEFDLAKVQKEEREELQVNSRKQSKDVHFTELLLHTLSKNAPSSFQMDKLKRHLVSIYRKFIRNGNMKLFINDDELSYETPEILNAPLFTDTKGKSIEWKKEIKYSDDKYKVDGFIGILNTMSTTEHNGLSLFRRGRVIEGSHDEKYKPKSICGQVGSPRYKRIFGELELEGFSVSFNKGSFQEQEDLEALMELIKIEISAKDFDLYTQAEKYIKPKTADDNVKVAKGITSTLKKEFKQENFNTKIESSIKEIEDDIFTAENQQQISEAKPIDSHEDIIEIKNEKYKLKVELITEATIKDLYTLLLEDDELVTKKATYKINLAHPFFERFEQFKNEDDYQPIISIIRSLVLAEIHSTLQGTKNAGNIRTNFNSFLRNT